MLYPHLTLLVILLNTLNCNCQYSFLLHYPVSEAPIDLRATRSDRGAISNAVDWASDNPTSVLSRFFEVCYYSRIDSDEVSTSDTMIELDQLNQSIQYQVTVITIDDNRLPSSQSNITLPPRRLLYI